MNKIFLCLILFYIFVFLGEADSHARLMDPESRSSRWRFNSSAPIDYNDNGGNCGGYGNQWIKNKGRCGVCGDDFSSPVPRSHELGGKYGEGVVVKKYFKAEKIDVSVFVTANHRGYFKFDMCNLDLLEKEDEECFSPLDVDDMGKKKRIESSAFGWYNTTVIIPSDLRCKHCVLRWIYVAGNNWGKCKNDDSRIGCGPQEEFRACSDIALI